MLENLRSHLLKRFIGYFESSLGGLIFAMTLGDDRALSTQIKHYFSVIGMQHVIAASGFNVGMILTLGKVGFSRFWGLSKVISLVGSLLFYVALAGISPSLLRASTQASIVIIGGQLGKRRVPAWLALAITVTLLSCFSFELWGEIGFQLSVCSTIGVLVADLLLPLGRLKNLTVTQLLFVEALQLTAAVQFVSFPLMWYHFGSVSLLTLPANTLLLWLTPILTYLGFFAVGVAAFEVLLPFEFFFQPVVLLLRVVAEILGGLFVSAAEFLSRFTNTEFVLPEFTLVVCCVWYGVLGLLLGRRLWLTRRIYQGLLR